MTAAPAGRPDADTFEVVVVGAGFGGSVMTYRLSQAGVDVCLLERGLPYPPGSFARGPASASGNFWNPSAGLYGLFNVWSFRAFLGQFPTYRISGGWLPARVWAFPRFYGSFLGKLWEVYGLSLGRGR